jgi:hypothetical protein
MRARDPKGIVMARTVTPITSADNFELPADLLEQLRLALKGLRFGTIELTVHEGAVVQIERREKVRISLKGTPPDNG